MSTAEAQGTADERQESLEAVLKDEVLRMYQEVAEHPEGEFHFYHGRDALERFGYPEEWLDAAPTPAVASFAGVGNPHVRAGLQAGETVLDLGSGAGLDAILAARQVAPGGRVVGVDMNPAMLETARRNAGQAGVEVDFRQGTLEDIPAEDASIDAILSNGVLNLSFRKRRVMEEMYRVLKPGGRISITDIVSAKQLSQSIINDPKLWAA